MAGLDDKQLVTLLEMDRLNQNNQPFSAGSVGIFMHHSFHALSGNGVFREESKGVEEWFEVRLANE
jgi:hypothetical protein